MRKIVVYRLDIPFDLCNLIPVLLYIKEGDAPDRDLQQSLYIVIIERFSAKLCLEWNKAIDYSLLHILLRLLCLDFLIDPLLDEDTLERPCPEPFKKMLLIILKLCCKDLDQMLGMEAYHLGNRDGLRKTINDDKRIDGDLLLTVRCRIQHINHVL